MLRATGRDGWLRVTSGQWRGSDIAAENARTLMGSDTWTSTHLFRQRSPLALAAVCAVTSLFVLVSLALNWAGNPQPLFASWVLFGLAVVWSGFVRPAVVIDLDGVTLRNVARDVHIPWTALTDVQIHWNLKVYVGERSYTAWAISSQVERPRGLPGGMFAIPLSGRLVRMATADATASASDPKITASMVARSIEAAKQEYDEAVAHRQLPSALDDGVRITWVPLVMAVLFLPALAVVALSLT
jgi:Bacterial PH domain